MAKKEVKGDCCAICDTGICKGCSLVALIVGVLFLLQDLGIWYFWNISWYTIGFLLLGAGFLIGLIKKK
ncbi:hypothetical protein KY342_00110 [Candidatus Woesearchaeota archaeon]|nr:hypothetical protein [Candidatus Woesearchaeota archaeon]